MLERRRRGEGNAVRFESSRTYSRILFDNAVSPVNVTLFAISIILIALGLFGDAVLTAGLVLGNVVVGVVQEGRAKRQLDKIALLTRPQSTVVRDGREQIINPAELVLGDLLIVRPGDQIQVDGGVLSEEGFSVDEALLTGESDLVRKHAGDFVYSGTFCMTGSAVFEAEKVGAARVAQQITAKARSFKNVRTPRQREVGVVIWAMAVFVAVLSLEVVNSFRGIYGGLPLVESTRAAAVIVALVPQGLWFMITVTYAMAIVRMARSGALIQRMNAVESISHVDVLCLDKTGTLTTNQLKLESIHPLTTDADDLRRRLGQYAASASFSNRTNAAIQEACGGTPLTAVEEVTFDSARKWSALVFDGGAMDGLYVMGAPEVLLSSLQTERDIAAEVEEWTAQGLRVLLFAHRPGLRSVGFAEQQPELPGALAPLGFVVLSDELRTDAAATVARFAEGGISLKILSGDHPDTVAALAQQAGFGRGVQVISGAELNELDDDQLEEVAEATTIFGRISPQHKERLVRALQRRGHYVAMIGDGVNDVPALKTAQVAAVMRSGSPVTRSVADIVLLEDSFAVLPATFLEGQRIRRGMEGIFRLFLVRTLSVALVILGAALLGHMFPVTPRHTAIIATLTVGIPSLALAAWARPGASPRFVVPAALDFVLPAAISIGLVGFAVYEAYTSMDESVGVARTALTATSVLCGVALIPYAHLPTDAWLKLGPLRQDPRRLFLALAMLVIFAVSFAVPPFRRFYELKVLGLSDYAVIALVACGWAVVLKALWVLQVTERGRVLIRKLRGQTAPAEAEPALTRDN